MCNFADMEHKLKTCRKQQRMTLEEVAERCDSSKSYLSKVENFSANPQRGLILRLCNFFANLEPNDFFVEPASTKSGASDA